MCGRGACTLDGAAHAKAIAARLAILRFGGTLEDNTASAGPQFNIAPGSTCRVVRQLTGAANSYELNDLPWGIKGSHFIVNARGEGILQKPMFKGLSRCVLFLSGYYEWDASGGVKHKQPYLFRPADEAKEGPLLALACLCSKQGLGPFVVVTRAATKTLRWIHDRVPLLLHTPEDIRLWLDDTQPLKNSHPLQLCIKQAEDDQYAHLQFYPVTKEVGKVAFQSPECVKKIELTASPKKDAAGGLMQWAVKKEAENPKKTHSPQAAKVETKPAKRPRSTEMIDLVDTEPEDENDVIITAKRAPKTTSGVIVADKRQKEAPTQAATGVIDLDQIDGTPAKKPRLQQKGREDEDFALLRSDFAADFQKDPSRILAMMDSS